MTHEKMSVHEALAELKMLDKRIIDKISKNEFCYTVRHNVDKIDGTPVQEVKERIKSVYDSIMDLSARRAAIRNALSDSNARTKVRIGDKEYSVAEAIEMKKSGIKMKEYFLRRLRDNYTVCISEISRANGDKLLNAADSYVSGLYGNKEKASSEEVQKAREAYIVQNTIELVDPVKISETIENLSNEITEFVSKVDAKLSVSNAITEIEIEY